MEHFNRPQIKHHRIVIVKCRSTISLDWTRKSERKWGHIIWHMGSSIFTSWFQLICGSQRSQLEFVLWWCGLVDSTHVCLFTYSKPHKLNPIISETLDSLEAKTKIQIQLCCINWSPGIGRRMYVRLAADAYTRICFLGVGHRGRQTVFLRGQSKLFFFWWGGGVVGRASDWGRGLLPFPPLVPSLATARLTFPTLYAYAFPRNPVLLFSTFKVRHLRRIIMWMC